MNLFAAVHATWVGAATLPGIAGASHAYLTHAVLARLLMREPAAVAGVQLVIAGDRLQTPLARRAVALGAQVSRYYGAAELSFVAWSSHVVDLQPFPGAEVATPGNVVWVRSPFVCLGYGGSPGPLRRDHDDWVSVGDRGVLRERCLRVRGRGTGWVTTRGATVFVCGVEQVLRLCARGDVYLLGVPHIGLGEVLVAALTEPSDLDELRAFSRTELRPAHRPRRWYRLDQVPLTSAGKLDRDGPATLPASPDNPLHPLV